MNYCRPLVDLYGPRDQESELIKVYHGVNNLGKTIGILTKNEIISPIRGMDQNPDIITQAIEETIRQMGTTAYDKYTYKGESFPNIVSECSETLVQTFGEDYRQLFENFSEYVNRRIISNIYFDEIFRQYCVWVSQEQDIAKKRSKGNGYFEFEIPKDSVIWTGDNGAIPRGVPLDFMKCLYFPKGKVNVSKIQSKFNIKAEEY